MIPSLMLAGPLAGYALGYVLRRALGWGTWVIVVMVLLGLVAGLRESVVILKKISRDSR